MNGDFWQAVMYAAGLMSGDLTPLVDKDICVIERPIAVARAPGGEYEIWSFESGVHICECYEGCTYDEERFAGPVDDGSIREILIGGHGK